MKVLNRLTLKHLFLNKKRTIVTIIGIILSTALMVGIGLLLSSFLNAMRMDAISYNGSYHASYDFLTKEEKKTLELNAHFSATYSYGVVGYAPIVSKNDYKPYLFVVSSDSDLLSHETLVEGRMPSNKNEIVLSNHVLTNGEVSYQVGDEITLDIGARVIDGEEVYDNNVSLVKDLDKYNHILSSESFSKKTSKTYKVVGIIKRSNMEDYASPGYMAFTTNEEDVVFYKTFAEYKKVAQSYSLTSEICKTLSDQVSCSTNDTLLYYYGVSRYSNINQTITSLLCISLGLLSVGCIIVIYNSFAISAMERKKSFGLYSSLGASPKQIKYTVFFEAFLVGVVGIFLGVLSAFLGIYITIQVLSNLIGEAWGINLSFVVEPSLVIIPVLFMILVVYISAFIPAHRSSKVSSIEMIRENDEIKMPRKRVKTGKWVRNIFGMEGEIALKNMKRNKRKYRITLLSIFISIVLFISFGTYVKLGLHITDITDNTKYDIYVSSSNNSVLEDISSMSEVDKFYLSRQLTIYTKKLDDSFYQRDYHDYHSSISGENEMMYLNTFVLKDDVFQELKRQTGIKDDTFIFLNQLNYTLYGDNQRKSFQTQIFIRFLANLDFCIIEGFDEQDSKDVSYQCEKQAVSYANEIPDLVRYLPVSFEYPTLFVSESMIKDMDIFKQNAVITQLLTINSKEYKKLYDQISKKYDNSSDIYFYSPRIELEEAKNSMLAIKILLYGFITLVTLIGVTSVFNTIHTSIHLRKKEFAMLRSVGMSIKGFNRMVFFESLFFGLKSLMFALPVSFAFVYLINISIVSSFDFGYIVIPWSFIVIAIIGVFVIVLLTMWYSVSKIKKENILNSLRDENI